MEIDIVAEAEKLARDKHRHQLDKAQKPYIDHPRRVADHARTRCSGLPADELAKRQAVAWLHDILEDTDTTPADLSALGFPGDVVDAVEAITKHDDEDRDSYYHRLRTNPIALDVKLADLDDNTDPERLELLGEHERARLSAKYAHARAVLVPTTL